MAPVSGLGAVALLLLLNAAAAGAQAGQQAQAGSTNIMGRLLLPPKAYKKGAGVRVLVDGSHATYARVNGSFFVSLTPGEHVVDFAVRGYLMPQIRIDVSRKTPGKYRAIFNDRTKSLIPDPIEIEPLAPINYWETREEVDWLGFLKNPMVLFMLVGLVLAFSVDPEQMKEASKIQKESGGLLNMLMNPDAVAEQQQQQQQQRKKLKKKN